MRGIPIAAMGVILFLVMVQTAHSGKPFELTVYYAQLTEDDFIEIPGNLGELEKRYLLAVSLRKEMFEVEDKLGWVPENIFFDLEGVLGHKWGNWKGIDQSFQEVAGSFNLRYAFPDNWINLDSISFGNGLSLTTKEPEYEEEITLNGNTSNLLYYLMIDIAFDLPYLDKWQAVLRVHHRSGVYGLIDNVDGGSNYLGFGLRYPLDFL
jgi:hypothetical protein